jgi:hypothetical protein
MYWTKLGGQQIAPAHESPAPQQSSRSPQLSVWPQPPSKSAQVFLEQGTQVSLTQASSVLQVTQVFCTPQPRSKRSPQPLLAPASASASAQVFGVQQPPSPPQTACGSEHVPHSTFGPQPLFTLPHVRPPHDGGLHATHWLLSHLVMPEQALHSTVPLPHAFVTCPHLVPPSGGEHSGGGSIQTPLTHC